MFALTICRVIHNINNVPKCCEISNESARKCFLLNGKWRTTSVIFNLSETVIICVQLLSGQLNNTDKVGTVLVIGDNLQSNNNDTLINTSNNNFSNYSSSLAALRAAFLASERSFLCS